MRMNYLPFKLGVLPREIERLSIAALNHAITKSVHLDNGKSWESYRRFTEYVRQGGMFFLLFCDEIILELDEGGL